MKFGKFALSLIACAALHGSDKFEFGLQYSKYGFSSTSHQDRYPSTSYTYAFNPQDNTALALQGNVRIADFGLSRFEVGASILLTQKSEYKTSYIENFYGTIYGYSDKKSGEMAYGYTSLSVRWLFNLPIDIGLGLEVRNEKVGFDGNYEFYSDRNYNRSTSFSRPWVFVLVGHVFGQGRIKPVIRLEFLRAMRTYSEPSFNKDNIFTEEFLKFQAPKSQLELMAGIRF